MRILIMGTGGLGGYFGGLLAHSGADVTFIARGANLQALQTQGLTVQSVHGNFTVPVQACADPAQLPPADVVLFCVKTYDSPAAAALLQPVVASHTVLLTLQNGVDTPYDLHTAFGKGTVLAGITRIGATLVAPGVIEQPTTDRAIEFGSLAGQAQPHIDMLHRLLSHAGIPVVISADIEKSLWEKLVFISAFSGIATLTGLPVAEILAQAPTRDLYRSVLRETATVAWAAQVNVAPDIVEQTMHYLDTSGDPGESSMAVDFQRRRRIEVEAIHGAVVRHGQRIRVPTPVNATLYAALTVMDQYNRRTPHGST
jgi:2-dehydropantoate 2-reductase